MLRLQEGNQRGDVYTETEREACERGDSLGLALGAVIGPVRLLRNASAAARSGADLAVSMETLAALREDPRASTDNGVIGSAHGWTEEVQMWQEQSAERLAVLPIDIGHVPPEGVSLPTRIPLPVVNDAALLDTLKMHKEAPRVLELDPWATHATEAIDDAWLQAIDARHVIVTGLVLPSPLATLVLQRTAATVAIDFLDHAGCMLTSDQTFPANGDIADAVVSHGDASRFIFGSGVHFKTDTRRYGGKGYLRALAPAVRRLFLDRGMSPNDFGCLLRDNALKVLAWYTPPAAEKAVVLMWTCSFCGKEFPETLVGLRKFDWRYCAMPCLTAHMRQRKAEEQQQEGGNNKSRGGTTSNRRQLDSNSWGTYT